MQITLHLGLEKTATSLIQSQLVSGPHYSYIGHNINASVSLEELNKSWNAFVMADFKSQKTEKILLQLENNLKAISGANNVRHLVISDERPTSVFGFETETILFHLAKILGQLDSVTVDKIVLTTREPSSWIVSHMAYHYLNWWMLGVDSPTKLIKEFISGGQFAKRVFSYNHEIIKDFAKYFDGVSVIQIPYEQLVKNPVLWLNEIKKNLGATVKISEVNRNNTGSFWPLNNRHLVRRGLKKSIVKTINRICSPPFDNNAFKCGRDFGPEEILCIEKFRELLKVQKFVIVGSGSDNEIKSSGPGIVFVNTSFSRLAKYKYAELSVLFLTEDYFDISLIVNLPSTQELNI